MSVVSVMSDLSSVFVRICPKDVGSVCYMYPHLFFYLIWYKPGITAEDVSVEFAVIN